MCCSSISMERNWNLSLAQKRVTHVLPPQIRHLKENVLFVETGDLTGLQYYLLSQNLAQERRSILQMVFPTCLASFFCVGCQLIQQTLYGQIPSCIWNSYTHSLEIRDHTAEKQLPCVPEKKLWGGGTDNCTLNLNILHPSSRLCKLTVIIQIGAVFV